MLCADFISYQTSWNGNYLMLWPRPGEVGDDVDVAYEHNTARCKSDEKNTS